MNEFVSRNALLDAMPKNDELAYLDVRKVICSVPTADVELLRHGRWIERKSIHADGGVVAKCSICKKDIQYLGQRLKFCPNCGAKMDLKE